MSNLKEMVAQIARSLHPTQLPPPSPPSTSPQNQFVTPPPPPPPEFASTTSFVSPSAATPSAAVSPAPIHERSQPQPAFHTSASKIKPGLAPLLTRPGRNASSSDEDSEVIAYQRRTNDLFLGRLPSSSINNKKDVAVLSHSRLDSAPEVFGEMPTSGSGYDYCPEHHNTTLTTCAPDSNPSEQNFEDIPQANGFHKLSVPEPVFDVYDDEMDVCSTEFVDVLAGIRVQQQQNDEKVSANVQQLRDSQLTVLVLPERRREWDPGALLPVKQNPAFPSSFTTCTFLSGISVWSTNSYTQQSCYYRVSAGQTNQGILFLWDPGILSLIDMKLPFVTIQLVVPYSKCFPRAQEERDVALVGCSAIHVCYLVSALLPPTQFAAKGPSNIELGVKKYCNAKKLLSSHNYLQIWEMDIIFITFLPP